MKILLLNFRTRSRVFALIGTLVIIALLTQSLRHGLISDTFATSDKKKSVATGTAIPVRTAIVKRENLPITVIGIGTVQAAMSVTVRSRIDGQLDSVSFSEGQDVHAGQLLARLDDRTYAAQVKQAEAQKIRDEALLANSEADLKRYSELVASQLVSRQQLDAAQAQERQLQATVQSDEAQLHAARVQLGFTNITAPIAGRIGARLVDPGNIVHVTDTGGLLVINQIDPIAVLFSLPERNFQAINAALNNVSVNSAGVNGAASTNNDAKLTVQALDRDTHAILADGKLVLLNNQIDVSTGTVALKAIFKNPQHRLWPGQSVDTRLILGTQENALTVPPGAVQRSQSGLFTYVVDADQTVHTQNITTGDADEIRVQVTTGLNDGDRVVIDGQYRLLPGSHVTEVPVTPTESKP
jgi:membrane fusion protein, multidrug efflux system